MDRRSKRQGGRVALGMLALALGVPRPGWALETQLSGRITFGTMRRLEAADPALLTAINAPLVGLTGAASGTNADDANLNFRRHDAVSTALKGYADLALKDGLFSALVRVKAWRDASLLEAGRPWGNAPNGYTAGAPLSDAGAAGLSRFSGVALMDAWVQHSVDVGSMRVTARVGQQTLSWGERAGLGGGLEALNARDLPALHRAGAVAQETRVPAPMLFARVGLHPALALEGFYGAKFRPTALDMCGTIWAISDYLAQGCDRVMAGPPAQDDRTRVRTGAFMARLPTPTPSGHDAGLALLWHPAPDTELGLYHARYTWRTPMPSLRKSLRLGPPLVAGDPGGLNMRYFTEYPEDIDLTALTLAHKRAGWNISAELSHRPRAPFMLAPGDVLPAFLAPTTPSLLRAQVDALAPGQVFHGYDLYAVTQAQAGLQREWAVGGVPLSAGLEVVGKHAHGLPDPAQRRYGRADLFGVGPVLGKCTVTTGDAARQCSERGYVSPNAYGYRLRVDARWPSVLPGLACSIGAVFQHDVKGWSGDFLLNQGRKSLNLLLRLEYGQRYLAELGWLPVWGGDYNALADRDMLAFAIGVRF